MRIAVFIAFITLLIPVSSRAMTFDTNITSQEATIMQFDKGKKQDRRTKRINKRRKRKCRQFSKKGFAG